MKVTWSELVVGATLAALAYRQGSWVTDATETEASWRDRLPERIFAELSRVTQVETYQNSGVDAFSCRQSIQHHVERDPAVTRWVVVRGTDRPWDWVRDLRIRKVAGPFGREGEFVHATWIDDAARLWSHMKLGAVCRSAAKHGERIAFVGHSLGGATAVMLAALARQDDVSVHLVMPISCPRVGSDAFVRTFERKIGPSRIFRFTRCRDAVCRVPMRRCGWRHVGVNHYFDRFGEYHRDPSRGYMAWDRATQKLVELTDMTACNNSAWEHHSMAGMKTLISAHAGRIAK